MGRLDYFRYFQPSRPRAVKGGIRAQSKGGKFGESWWARRWISVLESFNLGARLGRGRSYARTGQVLSIETEKGCVRARVQGSRPKPYEVAIQVKTLSPTDWQKVGGELSKEALFTAKLLAGEMPQDIEKIFHDARLSLFPEKLKDLKTECSCPDWSNPCKHIAAVYYLLGEAFDRDPFVIFRLRGRTQEEITAALRARRAAASGGEQAPGPAEEAPATGEREEEPLEACVDRFWAPGEGLEDMQFSIARPEVPLALLKRLGEPPFWPEGPGILETLGPIYQAVTQAALELAYGEDEAVPAGGEGEEPGNHQDTKAPRHEGTA